MKKTRTHKSIIKNLWTYALAFLLVLSNFTSLIQADEPDPQVDPSTPVVEETEAPADENPKEEKSGNEIPDDQTKPVEDENSENPDEEKAIKEDTDEKENDGLEISDPDVKPAVTKTPAKPKKPSINPVSIGDTKITGGGLIGVNQRKTFNLVCKIHVTIKNTENTIIDTKVFSIQPTDSSKTWSVNLDNSVQAGYTVTAKQEFGENNFSDETSVVVKQLLAPQYDGKLSMPELTVWSEDLHVLEADAIEDIKKAFINKNNELANIDGKNFEENASSITVASDGKSIDIIFTDNSTLSVDASNVTVKQITEVSTAPIIDTLKVVDGKITGRVDLTNVTVPARLRVEIVTNFGHTNPKDFCTENGCSIDKGAKAFAQVNAQTGEFSYDIGNNNVELGKDFGVIVKEYRKKNNCSTTTAELVTPEKTKVRNPRDLTEEDKKAIDKAIRDANTVNRISKLPDGTGEMDGIPAFIEFDKDGNARIISPTNVNGDWENYTEFIPYKKADGSLDVKDETEVITIKAEDLILNKAPDAPSVVEDENNTTITITPNLKLDTDINEITISYTDKDGNEKSATATKNEQGKWSVADTNISIDENTAAITISRSVLQGASTVSATVKDNGGLIINEEPEQTAVGSSQISADVKFDAGEGTGTMDMKFVKINNQYTLPSNSFTAPTNKEFKAWEVNGTEYAEGAKLSISGNTTVKAVWKDIEVKVSYNANGGSGEMTGATVKKGSKYSLSPNSFTAPDDTQEFKAWEVDGQEVAPNTEITVSKDTEVKAVWKKIQVNVSYDANGGSGDMTGAQVDKGSKYTLSANNFTAPDDTQEFKTWQVDGKEVAPNTEITVDKDTTVKAIWKKIQVNVSYDANGGKGTMEGKTLDKGSTYKLLANGFTAPENQEFSGWQIEDDTTNLKQANEEITISKDTVVKAIWKDIMVDITFDKGEGSGEMKKETVKKGGQYKLPDSTFTAPTNKKFIGWKVGDDSEVKAVGTEITVTDNTKLTAVYKDIIVKVTYDSNGGSGTMNGSEFKKGSTYKLLANGFTAPENQKFKAWKIGDQEYAPDAEITVNADTTVKAVWEDIMHKVTFNGNGGSGSMTEKSVKQGSKYTLPENGFTAPDKKQFKGWKIGDKEYAVGSEITVDADTIVTAVWENAPEPSPEPNPGPNPGDTPGTNPGYYYPDPEPSPNPKPNKPVEKPIEKPVEKPGQELERGFHERYLYGYVDGTVRPEGFITRCEAAALIARLANLDMTNADKPNFPDTPSAWYNTAINAVVAKNLMFADANGNFRPQEPITRGEFARALYYIDRHNDEVAPFEDIKGHIYEAAINQAYGNGLINGYLDGTFKPDAPIQRAEATKILNKYANRGVDSDGLSLVRQDLIHFTDIDERHWAYYEIMEAANTHEYERVVSTLYETWLKIVYDTKMK